MAHGRLANCYKVLGNFFRQTF